MPSSVGCTCQGQEVARAAGPSGRQVPWRTAPAGIALYAVAYSASLTYRRRGLERSSRISRQGFSSTAPLNRLSEDVVFLARVSSASSVLLPRNDSHPPLRSVRGRPLREVPGSSLLIAMPRLQSGSGEYAAYPRMPETAYASFSSA